MATAVRGNERLLARAERRRAWRLAPRRHPAL